MVVQTVQREMLLTAVGCFVQTRKYQSELSGAT